MSSTKAGSSSLDGSGGIEPVSEPRAGPRHIYYRIYTKQGALESNNPIYSNDRFISHIVPRSVAPPHTAASLKKHICRIERFELSTKCTLYSSLSDQAPVEDSTRLALRGTSGPGVSEVDPVVLVVDVSDAEKRPKVTSVEAKDLVEWSSTRRYVYYRVYDEAGEISSKTAFDDTDSCLGRVGTLCISPPYTALSLKYCIMEVEGVNPDRICNLFEDEGGENTMKDGDAIALLSDNYPGVSKEEPLAIVYALQKDPVNPSEQSNFTKKLISNTYGTWGDYDHTWHTTKAGEIFHTDGILLTKTYQGDGEHACYAAINSSGKKALIYKLYSSFG